MFDPASALAIVNAIKNFTFETTCSFASALASIGIVGSYNGGTTISACETVLVYLGVSPHWTQLVQSWADSHRPVMTIGGSLLLLVCLSLFRSNLNVLRTASTTAWGTAIFLSVKTPEGTPVLLVFFVIVIAIFLGRKRGTEFFKEFAITVFFHWIVTLWELLSGVRSTEIDISHK